MTTRALAPRCLRNAIQVDLVGIIKADKDLKLRWKRLMDIDALSIDIH